MIREMKTFQLNLEDIRCDHAHNFSRRGREHDPQAVADLAEQLLKEGQLNAIEVYPLAWATDEEQIDNAAARAAGYARRAAKKKPDAYGLTFGYRRFQAALLLAEQGRTSEKWSGQLFAVLTPEGASDEDLEDRNLSENVDREGLTPIDEAEILSYLTRAPDNGGRGESVELAAARLRLRGGATRAHKLLRLGALIDEARELVRANHRSPEVGITVDKAVSLAKLPATRQLEIINASKDAAGRVTPKAINSQLAPHQGRAGQPPSPSGAALSRLAERLRRMADNEHTLKRAGITKAEAELLRGFALLLQENEEHGLSKPLATLLRGGLEP